MLPLEKEADAVLPIPTLTVQPLRRAAVRLPRLAIRLVVAPAFAYFACFVLLTFPLLGSFSTRFFGDGGDGLGNVWNLWWTRKALTEMHVSPWSTSFLHYPHGTTLLAHTLNLFNGYLGILLAPFLSLVQVVNTIIVFAFVASGVTAFWLCYYLTRSWAGSFVGGYLFTFCQYHFAHAQGHMNLVSLEFFPLFVLCWYVLLERPGVLIAVSAALALYATALCDYYYLLYGVLIAVLLAAGQAARHKSAFVLLTPRMLRALSVFVALTLATTGATLVFPLLWYQRGDPFLGAHGAGGGGLDLLALVIPGGHWRWAFLTEPFWSRLPGNIHETSAGVGLAVLFVVALAWRMRGQLGFAGVRLWCIVFGVFALLAIGPNLMVWGREIVLPRPLRLFIPYRLLERLFPPLQMSGMPVRMMIVALLGAAVLFAMLTAHLLGRDAAAGGPATARRLRRSALAAFLFAAMALEHAPSPLPETSPATPAYVNVLARTRPDVEPEANGVIDLVADRTRTLYYQTRHEKPLAFGYISRVPRSVDEKDRQIKRLLTAGRFDVLRRQWGFRYLVLPAAGTPPRVPAARLIHQDRDARLFELTGGPASAATVQEYP